ncbi:disulfide bond formation protein DsbA [Streptomyces macrosporus]|uniref:DsbA family protein n=1 Tax=Streptomyces macrosporus TaxID=44032 RepID=A0ABP5X0K2_9ACTN
MTERDRTTVDFWFDPICPYTWLAFRWLREVEKVRPVRMRPRLMSLRVLNEGREVDPEDPDGRWGDYLWYPVRLCAAVEREYGADALVRLYEALGRRLHVRGEWDAFPDALAAAGLPARPAAAVESAAYDGAIRASHARAVALVGEDVGTPVIGLPAPDGGRVGLFGPVVSPAPRGEDAGRLWDGLLLLASVPGFFELKRTRTGEPDVG